MERTKLTSSLEEQVALKSLWDNMEGEICIIYPSIGEERWTHELKKLFNGQLRDSKASSPYIKSGEGCKELAEWLTRFGPHMTSGDVYACMHIMMLLVVFYGAENVKFIEAFDLVKESEDAILKILKGNIILIGGPSGNPISYKFLKDCNLDGIFPRAPEVDFEVVMFDGTTFSPYSNQNDPSFIRDVADIGVFLKRINPYNSNKFVYAAMGSNSKGTQGAAALACSIEGANIIQKAMQSDIKLPEAVIALTCIKIFKNPVLHTPGNVSPANDYQKDNRDLKFNLIWPDVTQITLSNPSIVNAAVTEQFMELKLAAIAGSHVVLPFGWGRAFLMVLSFITFTFLATLTFQKQIEMILLKLIHQQANMIYSLPIMLLVLFFGIRTFFRLPNARSEAR